MSNITAARLAATKRILDGDGQTTREQRKAAFANEGAPEAARALLDKVTARAAQIGDEDIAAVKAAGLTEDQIFELVVSAAMGVSTRQYEGALAALAQATETK
jgi:alkylhydroperoxidase family enzyme